MTLLLFGWMVDAQSVSIVARDSALTHYDVEIDLREFFAPIVRVEAKQVP